MNNPPIIVATTANDNYFHGLCVTVLSAIVSTHPDFPLSFRIFDTGISEPHKQLLAQLCGELKSGTELRFLPITESQFTGLNTDHGGGYSTYARLLMGSLIPESRVIYIDSDFLVLQDLSQAWSAEMAGNMMLATRDMDTPDGKPSKLAADCPFAPAEQVNGFDYYNCGFLVVDLDAWRETLVEDVAFSQIKGYESQLKAWDQTILNYVLRGKIGEIDPNWCWSCQFGKIPLNCNIHYISRMKPWNAWATLPAYKLWYLFHRIFVAALLPLDIPFKAKCRGLLLYLRDLTFFKFSPVGELYVKRILKRKGAKTSGLYATYLRKCRLALANPEWRSEATLTHYMNRWNTIRNRS